MNIFHAFILGVVEGITEFLPISSTGHLILAAYFLKIPSSSFLSSFEIAIQLGAILSVVVLYGKRLMVSRRLFSRVVVAFIPTGILGFLLYKVVKHYLMGNRLVVLASLFIGGICLVVFENWHREKPTATEELESISYQQCLWIGVFQSLAMIPGVSRSAATIVGGLLLGLKRRAIVEFSFLLAVPTLLAATVLDLLKHGSPFSRAEFGLFSVGFVTSFVVAMISIRFLLKFIKTHDFKPFGYYRIAVSTFFWFLR